MMKLFRCLSGALAALFILAMTPAPGKAQETFQVGNTTLTASNVTSGIQLPWELLWGPDDFLWVTTRPGTVYRINPETGATSTVLTKSVTNNGSGEPGMLGMAMHPEWETTPKVFIVYTTGSTWNGTERLSVFDWNGVSLVNEQILLTLPAAGIHNGSRLLVLPDNTLLMTTGDVGDGGASSQNLNSLNGKILRLNLDGSVPADNPTPGSYVYSYGHRNPQGLALGQGGIIYSSEHGQSNDDEVNVIEPGRNYGWPNVEGMCNTSSESSYCAANNVREPIDSFSPCAAVNGMTWYNHPAIPGMAKLLASFRDGWFCPERQAFERAFALRRRPVSDQRDAMVCQLRATHPRRGRQSYDRGGVFGLQRAFVPRLWTQRHQGIPKPGLRARDERRGVSLPWRVELRRERHRGRQHVPVCRMHGSDGAQLRAVGERDDAVFVHGAVP